MVKLCWWLSLGVIIFIPRALTSSTFTTYSNNAANKGVRRMAFDDVVLVKFSLKFWLLRDWSCPLRRRPLLYTRPTIWEHATIILRCERMIYIGKIPTTSTCKSNNGNDNRWYHGIAHMGMVWGTNFTEAAEPTTPVFHCWPAASKWSGPIQSKDPHDLLPILSCLVQSLGSGSYIYTGSAIRSSSSPCGTPARHLRSWSCSKYVVTAIRHTWIWAEPYLFPEIRASTWIRIDLNIGQSNSETNSNSSVQSKCFRDDSGIRSTMTVNTPFRERLCVW